MREIIKRHKILLLERGRDEKLMRFSSNVAHFTAKLKLNSLFRQIVCFE
jgi:hypothetical protein